MDKFYIDPLNSFQQLKPKVKFIVNKEPYPLIANHKSKIFIEINTINN